MTIEISKDGKIKWSFYRKHYKKARWRRAGQRELNWFLKFMEENPGAYGIIIVV